MLRYIISVLVMLMTLTALAQDDSGTTQDSLQYELKYGLRLGGDLHKLVRSAFDEDYTGFEINGDFRLTHDLYVAGEIGFEEKTTSTEFLNSTANGSYIKGGVDYNMYKNWFGMENMIYAGFRGSFATFSQTINSYTIYNTNQTYPQTVVTDDRKIGGLTAIWAEVIIGIKAETLNNLFVGLNVQLKGRITESEPANFENIYIPGFGRTYDSGRFGFTFGYNLSYLIPIFKKEKTVNINPNN